jgi:hypothetical protein
MYTLIRVTRFLQTCIVRLSLCLLAIAFVDFAKSTSFLASNSVATRPRLCINSNVLQRILCLSQMQPDLSLVDILRDEIICSRSTKNCPIFRSNSTLAENQFNNELWQAKRMDIAAVRVLGCAIADGHTFSALYYNPKDLLQINGMCRLTQRINLLSPIVEYSLQGQLLNRTKNVHASENNQWYRSFGYNPLEINDSRLAYEAPALTPEDWMQFCFREITRQSNTSDPPSLPSLHSRAWYACDSFATSTYSKNYQYGMLKCFDVPASILTATPEQRTALLPSYGSEFHGYIEQCRLNISRVSDDPWSLRDLARDVFYVLRDRWNAVQSVYELAIYEENKDVQRADEFCETLQWNTCHPSIEFLHLFVEHTQPSTFNTLTCHRFHDPCKKVRLVTLGKRMHYKDPLVYANGHLPGRIVMITNADIIVSEGFDSMFNLHEFLKKNNRMFALSRHERLSSVCRCLVSLAIFDSIFVGWIMLL